MIAEPQTQTTESWSVNRIKVLFLSIYYPLFMGKYFDRAFRRRDDIDFLSCGPYTGTWIPWMGGMNLKPKYANSPTIPLGDFPPNVGRVSYDFVKAQLPQGWVPDLIVACDAGINWTSKPQDGIVVTIGTDPHVLNYDHQRKISDKFFNMQMVYSQPKDIYLPYAYDPTVHYHDYTASPQKDTDAVLVGMPYDQRVQWVNELRKHGVSVIFENSPVFDEYRELANRARIGLNWSSMLDLNARFFETPAFGLPMVTNRVPDAGMFLAEGLHWLGFTQVSEAVEQVLYLKNNPERASEMGNLARMAISPHTYDARVDMILKECGLV